MEGGGTGRCCSLDDVYDARRVAEQIGVPYYVVNFERQFEDQVVKPFVAEYLAGRTPIPCTLCNNYIKFDRFLEMADGVGARLMATGHYARTRFDAASGRYQLLRAVDASKDQTYFLFGLTQQQLSRTLFPLGRADQARGARAGAIDGPGGGREGRQPGDLLRAQRRLRGLYERLSERDRRGARSYARPHRLERWPHAGRARARSPPAAAPTPGCALWGGRAGDSREHWRPRATSRSRVGTANAGAPRKARRMAAVSRTPTGALQFADLAVQKIALERADVDIEPAVQAIGLC